MPSTKYTPSPGDTLRRGAGWTSKLSLAEGRLDLGDGAARSPFSPAAQCFYDPRCLPKDAAAGPRGGCRTMILHYRENK